jgi:hypothetical protein
MQITASDMLLQIAALKHFFIKQSERKNAIEDPCGRRRATPFTGEHVRGR